MHLKSVLCRHHCPGACNFQTNILLIIKIKWQKLVPNLRWKSLFLSCVLLCHTLQYYSAFLTRKASVPSKKCIFSIKIKINMILWKFWKNAYFNLFNAGPFPNKVFSLFLPLFYPIRVLEAVLIFPSNDIWWQRTTIPRTYWPKKRNDLLNYARVKILANSQG